MTNSNKLAINGGKPIRNSYLQYGKQFIDEDDIQAVVNVLKGDYLTTGPMISLFEKKISNYVGSRYAVVFSSGTAALHGACFAADIAPGDEVITTPMTFAASANCILYQGAKPVFADIDPLTYNIDPHLIEKQITQKTKAIIPVDFTGQPANLEQINNIASKYNLIVMEDAAHALGAWYKDKKVGSISDMTMFSFHPVKNITTGEGGVITTDNKEYYDKLIQFRNHGITRDAGRLQNNEGPWSNEMQFLGHNYRMTDIQAALGISQLKKLDEFNKQRRHYANLYNEAFRNIVQVEIPFQHKDCISSWHLYVLHINLSKLKASRKEIFEALIKENIGVNVHYPPVYYHPYYHQLGYKKGTCKKAEELYEKIISLPLFPSMTEQDVKDVINAVKKIISFYKK